MGGKAWLPLQKPDFVISDPEPYSNPTNTWLVFTSSNWPAQLLHASPGNGGLDPELPQWIVQGRGDTRIQVVDISTEKMIADLDGHEGTCYYAALASDGSRLVTLGEGKTRAKLWDPNSGKLIKDLDGFQGGVWEVAFSGNNTRFITADGLNKTARIFDALTGVPLLTLESEEDPVNFVALSADGKLAFTGSRNGKGRLWKTDDPGTSQLLGDESCSEGEFSPSGSHLVTFSGHTAMLFDLSEGGKRPLEIDFNDNRLKRVAFSPDGTKLLGVLHNRIEIRDARSGKRISVLNDHEFGELQACFTGDGKKVISLDSKLAFSQAFAREWSVIPKLAPPAPGRWIAGQIRRVLAGRITALDGIKGWQRDCLGNIIGSNEHRIAWA